MNTSAHCLWLIISTKRIWNDFFLQVIDPWGKVLAECDKDDESVPQCLTATIALDSLMSIRNRLPCFEHRRNDVYSLAPIKMVTADKSVNELNSNFTPIPIEEETTPYFLFEKYPVPKSSTFLETPLSIAFTNIRCVVPGRKFNFKNHITIQNIH